MSNTEAALEAKALAVPPGTLRHTVLQAAKRFKSSWVELGKLLVKVRDEALFSEWGYEDFDAYCAKELRIRKATALKLTRSFGFLSKHEPEAVTKPDIVDTAPAFEVVEVLAGAEERGQLSASDYKSIRDSIWNPQSSTSELRAELKDRFPTPEGEGPSKKAMVRRFAAIARRLATDLKASRAVSHAVVERAEALAEDLDEMARTVAEA